MKKLMLQVGKMRALNTVLYLDFWKDLFLVSLSSALANNIYIIPQRKLNCLSQEHIFISNYFNT